MRLKRKRKYINTNYLIFFIIVIQCYFMLSYVSEKVSNIAVDKLTLMIKKDAYKIIYKNIDDLFVLEDINNVIEIIKNDNGEIVSVNYRFDNCYKMLDKYIDNIYRDFINTDFSDQYYDNGVYFISSSLINNGAVFNNFGINVPMKINVVSDMRSNFKTKVVNYGMNNVLVELYLVVKIESWFINPFDENKFGEEYEYIISSQIINGSIPQYFGGAIEKASSIVTS